MARFRRDLAISPQDSCQIGDWAPSHPHNHAQGLGKGPDLRTWMWATIWLKAQIHCGCTITRRMPHLGGEAWLDLGEILLYRPKIFPLNMSIICCHSYYDLFASCSSSYHVMGISVLHTNFLTYVVEPFSYPKNYKKTKQSHFATTSRPVEGFSHEDSSSLSPLRSFPQRRSYSWC